MASAVLHLLKYYARLEPAQNQTTAAERDAIARHARGRRRAVEIGVYEGVSTGVIAGALAADGVLYGIDPFFAGRLGICWGKPIAVREAHRQTPRCRIEFVELTSHAACEQLTGEFDFVFIDGDHSWDGIVQDWQDWSPRVQPGGIIALHDTLVPPHNPRVAQLGSHRYFVQHIQHDERFRIIEQVDSLSVLQRIESGSPQAAN
jgi:predicted O-methyltransferase YrrM